METEKKRNSFELWSFILSFFLSFGALCLSYKAYEVSEKNLETIKAFESLRMVRELSTQFNTEQTYLKVRVDIESCNPLYKSWGGPYSHDTLNIYLNFFEGLAFLNKENMLDIRLIDYFFGAYLVEASVHPHIEKYIEMFHKNGQPNAFIDFRSLSQNLISDPITQRKKLADSYRKACSEKLEK